ncbi:MAG: hypothetical protein WDO06_09865 [Actinomycetota bacterium]
MLLVAAILLQIAYPLVDGKTLQIVTIGAVYTGAAAMLLHAYYSYGTKYLAIYFSITFIFSLI